MMLWGSSVDACVQLSKVRARTSKHIHEKFQSNRLKAGELVQREHNTTSIVLFLTLFYSLSWVRVFV